MYIQYFYNIVYTFIDMYVIDKFENFYLYIYMYVCVCTHSICVCKRTSQYTTYIIRSLLHKNVQLIVYENTQTT